MGETVVLEKNFADVYNKFAMHFFQMVFEHVRERDGSLSAMEAFSLEVIHLMGRPTIGEFADFLNISQSNATYKVNSLMKKGYIDRENSQIDRREYHLVLSEKFYSYLGIMSGYQDEVMQRVKDRLPPEDVEKFSEILGIMSEELMPEWGAAR